MSPNSPPCQLKSIIKISVLNPQSILWTHCAFVKSHFDEDESWKESRESCVHWSFSLLKLDGFAHVAPVDLLNQLNSSIIRMKWHNLLLKTHSARNGGVWGPKFEDIWVPSALRLHLKLLFVGSKCVCVGVVGRLCDARDQQYLLSYRSDTIWNLL